MRSGWAGSKLEELFLFVCVHACVHLSGQIGRLMEKENQTGQANTLAPQRFGVSGSLVVSGRRVALSMQVPVSAEAEGIGLLSPERKNVLHRR